MRGFADRIDGSKSYATIDDLIIELPKAKSRLGIGQRIVVPSNQVHVVSSEGRHSWAISKETKVYGSSADAPTYYWRNALTQIIPLSTVTFMVPVSGATNIGIVLFDKNNTKFTVVAHVVASLNVAKAEVAASKVGHNLKALAGTIEEVTQSQLLSAAARMVLDDIMDNRQVLADAAKEAVDQTLEGLGYNLELLTIENVGGFAFDRHVEEANAIVTRDTTIEINEAELKTHESIKGRERTTAEVNATTLKKTEGERLAAEREVATLEIDKQETVDARQHELDLKQAERSKANAEANQSVQLRQVELDEEVDLAEAERQARVKSLQQEREKSLGLQASDADAKRLQLEQERTLEREMARTEAEAERLEREKLAQADRDRKVKRTQAEAEAEALQLTTEAQTQAELLRAQRTSEAAEKQAEADKKLAEATRAKEAAQGLADADVESRKVEIAGQQVEVDRERGLAEAEIAKKKAEAEIEREKGLRQVEIDSEERRAELYEQNPVLAELEKLSRELTHQQELARIDADARVRIFEAIAPHMDLQFRVIGDGSRASQVIGQIMSIGYGVEVLGNEVPAIGRMVDNLTQGAGSGEESGLVESLQKLLPHIQKAVSEMNPRMFSRLTVADLVTELTPVIAGEKDLVAALGGIKESASFRMIADIPVQPLLERFGIGPKGISDEEMADEELRKS